MLNDRAKLIMSVMSDMRAENREFGEIETEESLLQQATLKVDTILINMAQEDTFDWDPKNLQKGEIEVLKLYKNTNKIPKYNRQHEKGYNPHYMSLLCTRNFIYEKDLPTGEKENKVDDNYKLLLNQDVMEKYLLLSEKGKQYITDHPELFGEEAA